MNDGVAIGVTRTAIPNASGLRKAAAPTSTAAIPTRLWKAATSCGIAVILILRAVTRPMPPPITMAAAISKKSPKSPFAHQFKYLAASAWPFGDVTQILFGSACVTSVVPTAMAMPSMPVRLPRRLLSGPDSPRSARMKQTPATR